MDAAIESYAAKLGAGVSIGHGPGGDIKPGSSPRGVESVTSKYSSLSTTGLATSLGLGSSRRVAGGGWDHVVDLRGLPRLVFPLSLSSLYP